MERIRSLLFLAQWHVHDYVKFRSRWLSIFMIVAWRVIPFRRWRRWRFLLAAHRHSYNAYSERMIARHRDTVVAYCTRMLNTSSHGGPSHTVFMRRMIVLKEPILDNDQVVQKGVLLAKFTDTLGYLYRNYRINSLLERFYLVLEPSWSGYAQPPILVWLNFKAPIIVQASETRDRSFLEHLNSNLNPIDIGASDWVDHRVFHPLSGYAKDFDAVLVGDAGLAKRIHVFLRAAAHLKGENFRCAVVIGAWGTHRLRITSLITYFGLEETVTAYEAMPQSELNVLLNRSKVNVLLSLKEGSNRALFEGFFAGVPGLLLRENVGVNKAYVNEHTGMLIDESELADTLLYMKRHWHRFEPRAWAMRNISFERTTRYLERTVSDLAAREGRRFSGPLYEKVNVPEATYPDDPNDRRRRTLLERHLEPFEVGPADTHGEPMERPAPPRVTGSHGARP